MRGITPRIAVGLVIGLLVFAAGKTFGQGVAYYSMQNTNWPPFPTNFFPALDVYSLGGGNFTVDDRAVDYDLVARFSFATSDVPSPPGDDDSGGSGDVGPSGATPSFTTNDLWIELLQVTNSQAFLRLHNTTVGEMYQLQSKQVLNRTNPPADLIYWVPGQIVTATTNQIDYSPVDATPSNQFFRAQWGDKVIDILRASSPLTAIRPLPPDSPAVDDFFHINSEGADLTGLTVYYRLSGAATNGVDYTLLPGSTNFVNAFSETLTIDPLADTFPHFDMDVVATLIPTNTYLIDPDLASASLLISDNFSNAVLQLVTNLNHPVGMGYHPVSNSLVVSFNWDLGSPVNFARVKTNGLDTNWSGVHGLQDEIKLTIVQSTTNGFTNGDMFFGNGTNGGIGWLSADGTRSNLNWLSLTSIEAGEKNLRGGLYMDRTGIFSNNLIAVTGGAPTEGGGVWRIASPSSAVRLANIFGTHLEGVVTLPNDTNKYGPWAGKIVTGAESKLPLPLIFTIDTNGAVASFFLDIQPEDFHIIPTNQDFYVNDNETPSEDHTIVGRILKLPRNVLSNYWGDLLITQAGEFDPTNHAARLFIVHWDSNITNFVKHSIPNPSGGDFEHGSFAPIDIPATIITP